MPHLTSAGQVQWDALRSLLAGVPVGCGVDIRSLTLCEKHGGDLSSAALYKLSRFGGVAAPHAAFVWGSRAPSRVRFFVWLLVPHRIHTRDALLQKTIIAAEGAGCPVCSAAMEMADHLVFGSPFALAFWQKVGIVVEGAAVRALHLLRPGPVIGATSPGTFLQLCCWQLWKHCNSKKYIYRPRIMFILIKHVSTTYL